MQASLSPHHAATAPWGANDIEVEDDKKIASTGGGGLFLCACLPGSQARGKEEGNKSVVGGGVIMKVGKEEWA